jgi:hypothetical protein
LKPYLVVICLLIATPRKTVQHTSSWWLGIAKFCCSHLVLSSLYMAWYIHWPCMGFTHASPMDFVPLRVISVSK